MQLLQEVEFRVPPLRRGEIWWPPPLRTHHKMQQNSLQESFMLCPWQSVPFSLGVVVDRPTSKKRLIMDFLTRKTGWSVSSVRDIIQYFWEWTTPVHYTLAYDVLFVCSCAYSHKFMDCWQLCRINKSRIISVKRRKFLGLHFIKCQFSDPLKFDFVNLVIPPPIKGYWNLVIPPRIC